LIYGFQFLNKNINIYVITVRQIILWTASVFLLYLVSAKLGLKYAVIGQTVTLLWPPSGVALAETLIVGYRL
jgi:integral membrane sensor domain MASE1